ncbi:MAG: FAD-dependent oxidoreductase [Anaerolineae bacterium]|nr:FAD-dependent oxidoreductase [Anaerolineae bacterium]
MTDETIKVVVLGGGYAGIMAALRVAGKTKRQPTTVTLINALDYFVERPRLHEQATGTPLHGKPIQEMLRGSRAKFRQGWVKTILPDEQVVVVDTAVAEQRLPYDYLINALGSRVDRQIVPGVDEYAYILDPYGNLTADMLHKWLKARGARPFRTVVVGGGATGIEMAAQLIGIYPLAAATLITQGEAGAFKGPRIQKHIRQALAEQDISVVEHCRVLQVEPEQRLR